MLEGRPFITYMNHRRISFAFSQKLEKYSPRQFRYLDYIAQFTTDTQRVSGASNVVADALSRVEEVK